ncbi:hypothetical protein JCGZ_17100 [Jatropha curcas]|uniref:Uncharacterized protein n=1 Tax=Jatropha curcas TaxID=180498 RepID=A0A067K2C8_JATCU|nr:hypothetical protein JCGZ_17100 [Jatropha curcas]
MIAAPPACCISRNGRGGSTKKETQASSSKERGWCRQKIEEQEARRDFPIKGCRGSPALSAYAKNERKERRDAGIRCGEEATARCGTGLQ